MGLNKLLSMLLFAGCCLLCSCSTKPSCTVKELAPDGAWTWYNDERVIADGSTLLIGSIDSQGVSQVERYDIKTGQHETYPLSSWKSKDDHNNPGLLKLNNGKILACYSKHHHGPYWYSRFAEDINGRLHWSDEEMVTITAAATYNNLIQLSDEKGRIYDFMRSIEFNPTLMISDDQAQTWSEPIHFLTTDHRARPYVKYADNGKDRIDFLYTDGHPRNEASNNVYHLYYRGGNFYTSDGTLIKSFEALKDGPLMVSQGTRVYDGSTPDGRGWVWDLEYDKDGHPAAAYISSADHAEGNDLRYRYGRWDPKQNQWHQQQIAFAGTRLYVPENHYAGGVAIDPEDVNTVYISCDVDPVTGKPNETGHYQIYKGRTRDKGKTWLWKQLTFDADRDNLRPTVPRKHGCKMCVIWFQGEYQTYVDYKTRVVGIIKP